MKAYHMSQTLQVGDKLKAGYKRNEIRCREVISTLEQSEQCLETTIASMKLQGDEWREYVKWCVEGIFEFVRETEFSFLPNRLNCSYYFDNIEYYKVLYEAGWAQKSEEERAQIRLFEVDLEEEKPTKYDMLLFDEAFDVMLNTKNIKGVVEHRDFIEWYFDLPNNKTKCFHCLTRPRQSSKISVISFVAIAGLSLIISQTGLLLHSPEKYFRAH